MNPTVLQFLDLEESNLSGANLTNADIRGSSLKNCNMTNIVMNGTQNSCSPREVF